MADIVPTGSDQTDFEEDIDLGGIVFRLRIHYNGRDDSWYVTISDVDDNEIVAGVRLVLDVSLFGQYVSDDLPTGVLLMIDPEETRTDPTRLDLDDDAKALVHVPEEELA